MITLTTDQTTIYDLIKTEPGHNTRSLHERTGMAYRQIGRILKVLKNNGLIEPKQEQQVILKKPTFWPLVASHGFMPVVTTQQDSSGDSAMTTTLTDDLKTELDTIVKSNIENEEEFTAFDITTELRRRGHTVYHSEVKAEVNRLFNQDEMPGYSRRVGTGYQTTVQPMVYYKSQTQSVPDANDNDDEIDATTQPCCI